MCARVFVRACLPACDFALNSEPLADSVLFLFVCVCVCVIFAHTSCPLAGAPAAPRRRGRYPGRPGPPPWPAGSTRPPKVF